MGFSFWTLLQGSSVFYIWYELNVSCSHSWDVVHTYKVQFSNDSLVWKPCMNGTEEAVSEHSTFRLNSSLCTPLHMSDIWTINLVVRNTFICLLRLLFSWWWQLVGEFTFDDYFYLIFLQKSTEWVLS